MAQHRATQEMDEAPHKEVQGLGLEALVTEVLQAMVEARMQQKAFQLYKEVKAGGLVAVVLGVFRR